MILLKSPSYLTIVQEIDGWYIRMVFEFFNMFVVRVQDYLSNWRDNKVIMQTFVSDVPWLIRNRILLMFDSQTAPQVWHEYDHIGLSIDLYNSTLLFKASCEFLPSNQYILLYLIFISFLFFFYVVFPR